MRTLIALALVAFGTPALAQSYVGKWGPSLEQCMNPDSDSNIVLDRGSLGGYEHRCEFRGISERSGTWTTAGNVCEGEGETWRNAMRFSVNKRVLSLTTIQEGKTFTSRYVRCPR